jgi:hypothetical protein
MNGLCIYFHSLVCHEFFELCFLTLIKSLNFMPLFQFSIQICRILLLSLSVCQNSGDFKTLLILTCVLSFNLQLESEVCASKQPAMNEVGLDFAVLEKMAHLSEVVSILLMELESLKMEEKSITVTRDESTQKVRGVELVLQSFEAQLQAFEASLSSSSRTLKDDAKKDVILDMLREHRDQLKKLQDESTRTKSEL